MTVVLAAAGLPGVDGILGTGEEPTTAVATKTFDADTTGEITFQLSHDIDPTVAGFAAKEDSGSGDLGELIAEEDLPEDVGTLKFYGPTVKWEVTGYEKGAIQAEVTTNQLGPEETRTVHVVAFAGG